MYKKHMISHDDIIDMQPHILIRRLAGVFCGCSCYCCCCVLSFSSCRGFLRPPSPPPLPPSPPPLPPPPLHFILLYIISYVAPPPSCGPSWLHGSSASQAVLLIHALYVSLGCLLCVCPAFSDLYAPLAFCFPLFLSWCLRSPFLVSCSLPAFSVLPFAARHTLVQPCLRTIDKCAKPFF